MAYKDTKSAAAERQRLLMYAGMTGAPGSRPAPPADPVGLLTARKDAAMARYAADHNARSIPYGTSASGYSDPYGTSPAALGYMAPDDFTVAQTRLLERGASMQEPYVPNRFVEEGTGYAYEDLGGGEYAVFRDGVRTGTARRGSRAADSIASVIAGGGALPVRRGPSAMDVLQSERFAEHEAFRPERVSSAPYRGELTAQYETAALLNKG